MKNIKKRCTLAEQFGGEEMLIFWAFRYFLPRRSISASAFAATLAICVDKLSANIRKMMKEEIERGLRNPYNIPECMHKEWKLVLETLEKLSKKDTRNAT